MAVACFTVRGVVRKEVLNPQSCLVLTCIGQRMSSSTVRTPDKPRREFDVATTSSYHTEGCAGNTTKGHAGHHELIEAVERVPGQ